MTFTILHITIAFVAGYGFGALGMWMVQRYRERIETPVVTEQSASIGTSPNQAKIHTPVDEDPLGDDRTRIQTRPNLAIAKAPPPSELTMDTQGSLELVEELPLAPDLEDSEDTEDIEAEDDSSIMAFDPPTELTDEPILEDILGSDDTLPFVKPRHKPSI